MKNTTLCICTAAILLALFCSFTNPFFKNDVKVYKVENDLIEITPLIQTTIMLYDTTKFLKGIEPANSSKDYMERYRTQFLTYPAFNTLKTQLEKTYNDPGSLICFDAETVSTLKERKEHAVKGFFKKVNMLTFFESWYYNKQTGEVIKKQLGYAVGQWDHEKKAFREWYLHFTSQEARAKYVKNW